MMYNVLLLVCLFLQTRVFTFDVSLFVYSQELPLVVEGDVLSLDVRHPPAQAVQDGGARTQVPLG